MFGRANVERGCCGAMFKGYSFFKEVVHNAADCFISRYTEHCPLVCVEPEQMILRAIPQTLDEEATKESC
ncbi:hypothetical protein D3C85_1909490 [compost metagenome]